MSTLKIPKPVKLIAAVFSADAGRLDDVAARFAELAGELDYASKTFLFDHTEYYREEMGWPIYKRIFAVEKLADPTSLVTIKVACEKLEKETAAEGKRLVNIDPGYISAERLVLATGKNVAHRVYLGQGVWADLTLVFHHGAFRDLPWTFPDYASEPVKRILMDIRKKYLEQLKTTPQEAP